MSSVPPDDAHERDACSCGERPVNHPVPGRLPIDRTDPVSRDDPVVSQLSDHEVYQLAGLMARLASSIVRRRIERESLEAEPDAIEPAPAALSPTQQARARAAHARRLAAEKREAES